MGTDIHAIWQKWEGSAWVDIPSEYDQRRHYQLFAVLAGVRNGTGFAGVPTGDAVRPIACPRGLPNDFTLNDRESHPIDSIEVLTQWHREYRANYPKDNKRLEFWMGDHSHSYLTGEEMLAYWKHSVPIVNKVGVIDRSVYETWDKVSKPSAYCGGIAGQDVIVISDTDTDKSLYPNWTHIHVTWKRNLYEELSYFFTEVAVLVDKHKQIRFVFGFDS